MTTTNKVLGQSKPSAATLTAAYTVPGSTQAIVTGIHAANQSATATAIRVSIAINGASDTAAQYIAYDVPIPGKDDPGGGVIILDKVIPLGAGDVVRVYNTLATVSFNVFGQEIT